MAFASAATDPRAYLLCACVRRACARSRSLCALPLAVCLCVCCHLRCPLPPALACLVCVCQRRCFHGVVRRVGVVRLHARKHACPFAAARRLRSALCCCRLEQADAAAEARDDRRGERDSGASIGHASNAASRRVDAWGLRAARRLGGSLLLLARSLPVALCTHPQGSTTRPGEGDDRAHRCRMRSDSPCVGACLPSRINGEEREQRASSSAAVVLPPLLLLLHTRVCGLLEGGWLERIVQSCCARLMAA